MQNFTLRFPTNRFPTNRRAACPKGLVASLVILLGAGSLEAQATTVDSELLILVDVTTSIDATEFGRVMEGIAQSFESSSVINGISSGAMGSIAASLVFWSGKNEQQTGVSWLSISDASSAAQFATAVRSAARPFAGRSAIGSAIAYAVSQFGTETGGADNGYQSSFQSILLMGDGKDNDTPGRGPRSARVGAARDAAIAAGVDEISSVLLVARNAGLENYYNQNVLGSNGSTTPTLTMTSPRRVSVDAISSNIIAATTGPVSVIPEPSSLILLAGSSLLFLFRRRS